MTAPGTIRHCERDFGRIRVNSCGLLEICGKKSNKKLNSFNINLYIHYWKKSFVIYFNRFIECSCNSPLDFNFTVENPNKEWILYENIIVLYHNHCLF